MPHHIHFFLCAGDSFRLSCLRIVGICLFEKLSPGTSFWACPPAPSPLQYPGLCAVLGCARRSFCFLDRGWMPLSSALWTLKALRLTEMAELNVVRLGRQSRAVLIVVIWSGVKPAIACRASAKICLSSSPSTISLSPLPLLLLVSVSSFPLDFTNRNNN